MKVNIKKADSPKVTVSAYGGTAATYCMSEPQGEPFKEGTAKYINVKHNGVIKKVRWYADEAHHKDYRFHKKAEIAPLWSLLFFDSEDDKILCIKSKIDIFSDANRDKIDALHAAGFSARAFFGGCFLAPKSAVAPAGFKAELIDWPTLKKAGQEYSDANGFYEKGKGCWYE